MTTKRFFNSLAAAMIACCATGVFTSCSGFIDAVVGNVDNPAPTTQTTNDAAQLKQGIWTEYDEALLTSGKYTEDELAQMPTVAMWIQGDKGDFFTYTAETVSETVEGQISYNKSANTGTITFPYIAGNPLSIQTVNFSMTSDDVMEFEYTYEGKKTTGHCAWLCKDLEDWSSDITDEDWKELMTYYENLKAEGPDASIDWSKSVEVEDIDDEGNPVTVVVDDLDEPLVWEEDIAATRAGTRAIGIGTVISMGFKLLGALFSDDSTEKKLDAITEKVDKVLQGQQKMLKQLNQINNRLTAIAKQMQKQATIDIINERNKTYYNPLKVHSKSLFDDAYKLYTENKDDLSKVSDKLGIYAKKWVGNNKEYIELTWQYMEYLTTVQHSTYGAGMDKIYDGITYDEYPWEHLGTNDRLCYRGNDLLMITKCLFMICLYSTYCDLDDIDKKTLYDHYNDYRPQLLAFCSFNVSNPDEFRVCQIPGAHFVMRKELQKYNYGLNGKCPHPSFYGSDAVYRPEWHEKGSPKIENPTELKSKLIRVKEAETIYNYYKTAFYSGQEKISWASMLVGDKDMAGGATYSKQPAATEEKLRLMLSSPDHVSGVDQATSLLHLSTRFTVGTVWNSTVLYSWLYMGEVIFTSKKSWLKYYDDIEYYAAIVEKRY